MRLILVDAKSFATKRRRPSTTFAWRLTAQDDKNLGLRVFDESACRGKDRLGRTGEGTCTYVALEDGADVAAPP